MREAPGVLTYGKEGRKMGRKKPPSLREKGVSGRIGIRLWGQGGGDVAAKGVKQRVA